MTQGSNINSKYPIRLIIFAGSIVTENSISQGNWYCLLILSYPLYNQKPNQGHRAEKHYKSVKTRTIAFGIFQKQKVIKRGRREMS